MSKKRRNNELNENELRALPSEFNQLGFEEGLDLFVRSLKRRNKSRHTIGYYEEKVNSMWRVVKDHLKENDLNLVTLDLIEKQIIDKGLEKELKDVTINTKLRGIRAFFNFLHEKGHLHNNPVKNLELIREKKTVVNSFTPKHLEKLFKQPKLNTFTGFRDFTLMLLLLETGVRVREVSEITLNDLDLEEGYITINGKNFEQRRVPIQEKMKKQLQAYLKIRGEDLLTDALFVSLDEAPLLIRQIQSQIRKYGKKANIRDVRVSPHTFRHTFAKMSIQNGADVFTLQKILGHGSVEMVKKYIHLFSKDLKDGHKKFSPVEKLF